MKAACHCGAVRFEIAEPPSWVLDCNCTLCRRYGALWSYYHKDQAQLLMKPAADTTYAYSWNGRDLAFHYCKVCGCITHFTAIKVDPPMIVGVNARMMVGLDPSRVQLRQIDNGHTGFFFTKSGEPVIPGTHPPMPPPGPDDWR